MIYFRIATGVITALGIALYAAIFERKYIWKLLSIEAVCAGILSFCVFYYIGMYTSTGDDINLSTTMEKMADGNFHMAIDIKWNRKPEIFGFDGNDDLLVLRFCPDNITPVKSDKLYGDTETGKCTVKLSDDYKYFKIEKNEKEVYFNLKDGVDSNINMILKELKPKSIIKVFYLHDYKAPLADNVYWEKDKSVELK